MAIDAYTGNPRSGKSYSVVKNVILPSLREGRHVYTNIPMTEKAHQEFPEHIHQLAQDWYSSPDLADLFPPGAVVVLDELWRRWPSGMKANVFPFKDKEFLAEHGHNVDTNGNTTRVVLVTQDLADIAAFARGKVDKTYRSQKLDAVGADNRFRVDIYEGCVTGQKPPKSQFIRSLYDKYEAEVYAYYRSSTKSQTGDVGNEKRADKRANVWRSPWLIASLVAPVLLIPPLVWFTVGLFTSGMGMVDEPPEAESALVNPPPPVSGVSAQAVASVPAPAAMSQPPQPADSAMWRVVGSIQRSAEPAPQRWASVHGYNAGSEPVRELMADQVLLRSVHGSIRYVPASDCVRYSDGIHWRCEIDGEQVTPWTGRGSATAWSTDGKELVARTASVASGATNVGSPSHPATPPTQPTPANPAPSHAL